MICTTYLGMKNARLHHKDLLSREGEDFSRGRKCQDLNSTGVPLQRKEEVIVPGKDRGFL